MRSATIRLGMHLAILVWAILVWAWCPSGLQAQQTDLKKLEADLLAVEKVIADPLSAKRQFFDARGKLQTLLIRANEVLRDTSDEDANNPAHKVHDRIIKALKTVRARLPKAPAGVALVGGFPVPEYDDDTLLGELAGELHTSQSALAGHLHRSSKDDGRAKPLLQALILAQEKLAWEAGWPFTSREATDFRAAGSNLTVDVYLARRARGVERINKKLEFDAARHGRKRPRPFVIHSPEDRSNVKAIAEALAEFRGDAAIAWDKGTKAFNGQEQLALLNDR